MYQYNAFNLSISSELELPDLPVGGEAPDVVVRQDRIDASFELLPIQDQRCVLVEPGSVSIQWDGLGAVRIKGGREITIDPAIAEAAGFFRQVVQNIAMGITLHQRGVLTLHGSAVDVGGGAVVFIGWKGAGKSTTASALYTRGHALIADDVVAVDESQEGTMCVTPGIPVIKLWPDAVEAALHEDPDALPRVFDATVKRTRPIADRFSGAPLPLSAIYVLEYGADAAPPRIETLRPQDAFMELVRQSYALRFLGNEGASVELTQKMQRVVRMVRVARLRRPKALEALPQLAETILQDLHENPSG